ncbi:hypothetical protein ACFX13_007930 [Malus domestica]
MLEYDHNAYRTAARQEEFPALCESRGLKCNKFKPDMKTHWSSILLMLQSCVNYIAAITVYYNVAISLGSKVYSPNSCMALYHLLCISFTFSEHKSHSGFKAIYDIMESKFRSYYEFMLPSFCLAKARVPTMKLCSVEHMVNDISEFLSGPLKFDVKALDTVA